MSGTNDDWKEAVQAEADSLLPLIYEPIRKMGANDVSIHAVIEALSRSAVLSLSAVRPELRADFAVLFIDRFLAQLHAEKIWPAEAR